MRHWLWLAVITAFNLIFVTSPAVAAAETLRIGAILPLSGEDTFWGLNPRRGIELALKDLAGKDGSPRLEVIYEDDRCDAKSAVAAFHKLVNVDNVHIILGPSCSSASVAIAPLADPRRVLLFPFSEADALSVAGEFVFRLWLPNGRQMAPHLSGRRAISA